MYSNCIPLHYIVLVYCHTKQVISSQIYLVTLWIYTTIGVVCVCVVWVCTCMCEQATRRDWWLLVSSQDITLTQTHSVWDLIHDNILQKWLESTYTLVYMYMYWIKTLENCLKRKQTSHNNNNKQTNKRIDFSNYFLVAMIFCDMQSMRVVILQIFFLSRVFIRG